MCGGFGDSMVADLLREVETNRDGRAANKYLSMLQGQPGDYHVCEGLLSLHKAMGLYYTISAMRSVKRIQPLDKNLFIVCNDANRGARPSLCTLRPPPPLLCPAFAIDRL